MRINDASKKKCLNKRNSLSKRYNKYPIYISYNLSNQKKKEKEIK